MFIDRSWEELKKGLLFCAKHARLEGDLILFEADIIVFLEGVCVTSS